MCLRILGDMKTVSTTFGLGRISKTQIHFSILLLWLTLREGVFEWAETLALREHVRVRNGRADHLVHPSSLVMNLFLTMILFWLKSSSGKERHRSGSSLCLPCQPSPDSRKILLSIQKMSLLLVSVVLMPVTWGLVHLLMCKWAWKWTWRRKTRVTCSHTAQKYYDLQHCTFLTGKILIQKIINVSFTAYKDFTIVIL